jgi:hypothetical protein
MGSQIFRFFAAFFVLVLNSVHCMLGIKRKECCYKGMDITSHLVNRVLRISES